MMPFRDEDHAVELANATDYGLSGCVQSADLERARRVAGRLRTGMVHLNGAPTDGRAPFGGYKHPVWAASGVASASRTSLRSRRSWGTGRAARPDPAVY